MTAFIVMFDSQNLLKPPWQQTKLIGLYNVFPVPYNFNLGANGIFLSCLGEIPRRSNLILSRKCICAREVFDGRGWMDDEQDLRRRRRRKRPHWSPQSINFALSVVRLSGLFYRVNVVQCSVGEVH